MIWKGKELKTVGNILDAVCACESREEAQEFMRAYRTDNPHAAENVGYIAGYLDREERQRVFDWFDVAHPIFGRSEPSTEDAFKAGLRAGKGIA